MACRLLIFSDIHEDTRALERLMATPADYYIAAGDLAHFGRGLERCGEIMRPAGERVWVLPGNHESAQQIAAFCARFGFSDFHGRSFQAAGRHIAGLGYSNPTPFNTPGEYSEAELADRLAVFATLQPAVLVCHCPPRDTVLDRVRPGLHAGSTAVGDFLRAHPPTWFFCGHIHEAAGLEVRLGHTRAVNVGKQGYLLEL